MEQEHQFTWAMAVEGAKIDVNDAVSLFNDHPDISIRYTTGSDDSPLLVLTSPQLDALEQAHQVQETADRLLALVNGALFVLEPAREPLRGCGIRRRRHNGTWDDHIVIAAAFMMLRSRSSATFIGAALVDGKEAPEALRPPPATRWITAAQLDQVIADVLCYLNAEPDWFTLYKAFEMMRRDINCRLGGQHRQEQAGWPPKTELDHFTLSAGVYRHAPPWDGDYTPAIAMPLHAARRFVQKLASSWLEWRLP